MIKQQTQPEGMLGEASNSPNLNGMEMPDWPKALISLGECAAPPSSSESNRLTTIGLCLPRVDFAAVFIGLGLLKRKYCADKSESMDKRMRNLLGEWVSFNPGNRRPKIGRLAYCDVSCVYKIDDFNKPTPDFEAMTIEEKKRYKPPKVAAGATLLRPEDWPWVHPAGREYNPGRRVNKRQVEKLVETDSSMKAMNSLFGLEFVEQCLSDTTCEFTIFGNKSRLQSELSDHLSSDENSCLAGILRPHCLPDYVSSFFCRIEGRQGAMADVEGRTLILEAGRSLGDHLATSRKFNRIVLLGRNSADYDECAGLLLEEFSTHGERIPQMGANLPLSLKCLAFYHS